MKKSLLILFILCLPCSSTFAAEPEIYSIKLDARSLGLGQTASALTDDYPASLNPASLGRENTFSLAVSQARLAYDRYGYQIIQVLPWYGAFSLRFDQVIIQNSTYYRLLFNPDGTPVIDPVTNQQAQELAYDTRYDSLFGLAYGLEIMPGLTLGLEGQASHLKLGEDFAWGFDAQAGIGHHGYIDVSIVLKNLNRRWRAWHRPYREEQEYIEIEAGAHWLLDAWNLGLFTTITQRLKDDDQPVGRFGLEYAGFLPLTLRTGWDKDQLNLGAAFRWESIQVDYAVLTSGALYDANRITIKIKF